MATSLYAGSGRFHTRGEKRDTWHSFSFGDHYDPDNVGFGAITAVNDERLVGGAGYPDHGHQDLEIVTWVLEGALEHTDSLGRSVVLEAGTVQAQSAGSGIRHSEVAHPDAPRTRFVQTWLRPDEYAARPGVARDLAEGAGLGPVAGPGALPLGVAGARVEAGTLAGGASLEVDPDAWVHVFVAGGSLLLPSGERAGDGDALRIIGGSEPLRADGPTRLMVVSTAP